MNSSQQGVRREVLDIAARLLSEEGPAALTARRLAAEAGTSTMAVYTHFGGMPALVREVIVEAFTRLGDHLATVTPGEDTLDDLRRLAIAYRQNALDNPHLYAVMFGTVPLGRYRPQPEEPELGRYTFDVLVDGTRRAMLAGRLAPGDAQHVAAQLWSALHGYVMLELAGFLGEDEGASEHVLWPMLTNLVTALAVAPT